MHPSGTPALDFFETHPVFTHAEFVAAHTARGRSRHTSNGLLQNHLSTGRIERIRRGVYARVRPGTADTSGATAGATVVREYPDPYLIASRLSDDAVLSHHTALELLDCAWSVGYPLRFTTANRRRPFRYRSIDYVPNQAPLPVRQLSDFGGGILTVEHRGLPVRVTSVERCLVDLMHDPSRGGGWAEIWRSFSMVELVDVDLVVELAGLYRCALTAARVGFFLEQHREEWWVDDERLSLLDPLLPRQPIYLDATRHPGRLASRWNLVVPERMLVPQWAEQDEPQAVDAARVPRFDRRRLAWRDDQRAPALYP